MDIKINDTLLLNVLIYAIRYAIPRKTGAPNQVFNAVKSTWNYFSKHDQKLILESIELELKYALQLDSIMLEDYKMWEEFVEKNK
jgi:hypothetical protein